jgi:putative FmdB family regulatory protein
MGYIMLIGGDIMPIFEYVCKECKNKFEKLVRNVDNTDIKCPVGMLAQESVL